MNPQPILVRAFELARSGDYGTLTELRRGLSREGYAAMDMRLDAPTVRRQLRELCREHWNGAPAAPRRK